MEERDSAAAEQNYEEAVLAKVSEDWMCHWKCV